MAQVVGLLAGAGRDEEAEAEASQDTGNSGQWAIVNGKLKVLVRAMRLTKLSSRGGSDEEESVDDEESDNDEGGESSNDEAVHVHHPMLSAFATALADKNAELSAMGEPNLRKEEMVGGRM